MKVLRRNAQQQQQQQSKGSAQASAKPAAKPTPSSRPGIKIVSRAAAPSAPVKTGPSQEEVESRKVAKLLKQLAAALGPSHSITPFCDGSNDIDTIVGAMGFASIQTSGLLPKLTAAADDLGNADAREAALLAYKQLIQCVGRAAEPYVLQLLPMLLERLADRSADVRDAAATTATAVAAVLSPPAVELVLPSKS
jgi:hypothetical protein